MAKIRDMAEQARTSEAPVQAAAVQTPAHPAEADPREAELEVLRAKLARLETEKCQQTKAASQQLPGRWRIQLPGHKSLRSSCTVEPRLRAPEAYRRCKPRVYDGLELAMAAPGNPQAEAWRRYAQAEQLPLDAREHFKARMEGRELLDSLEIEAPSAADAFARFKQLNAITQTSAIPLIERVEGVSA